jgi:hypothetical protein
MERSGTGKREGVQVKAVTAWSLLGSYDWNSLLTRKENHYEPGVFDNRNFAMRKRPLQNLWVLLQQVKNTITPY